MEPSIDQASIAETDQVASIIGQAFADDPVTMWIFGGPHVFEEAVKVLMKDIYLPRGFVTMAEQKAASLWLSPGQSNDLSWQALLTYVAKTFPGGGVRPAIRGLQASDRMGAAKPKTPFLYLFAIGVDPSAQGQGLGSRLIKDGLREADTKGVPAYLESSKEENIPLYQRHGFEIVQELKIAKSAPPLWTMQREPRS